MSDIETATEVIERLKPKVQYGESQIPVSFAFISELTTTLNELRGEIRELRFEKDRKVIAVTEMPFDEAKNKILELIKENKKEGIETLDIAEKLYLSLPVVFKALEELEKEGKIAKTN